MAPHQTTTEDGRATPGTGEGEGGGGGCAEARTTDGPPRHQRFGRRPSPQLTGKHQHPSLPLFPTNAMTATQCPEPGGPPQKPRRRMGCHVTNALDDARPPQLHGKHLPSLTVRTMPVPPQFTGKHRHPSLPRFPTNAMTAKQRPELGGAPAEAQTADWPPRHQRVGRRPYPAAPW